MGKRVFDLLLSILGLVVLSPLMFFIALAVKLDSPGPVFFRQERIGQGGRIFRIHKFRTMVHRVEGFGLPLTIGGDPRITRVGRWLRGRRLDELAQLIDVVKGDMSLVGPRPEVPRYAAYWPHSLRAVVLSVRPGITDPASLDHLDENRLLALADDPEREYIEVILPRKLRAAASYVSCATTWTDILILCRTLKVLIRR